MEFDIFGNSGRETQLYRPEIPLKRLPIGYQHDRAWVVIPICYGFHPEGIGAMPEESG